MIATLASPLFPLGCMAIHLFANAVAALTLAQTIPVVFQTFGYWEPQYADETACEGSWAVNQHPPNEYKYARPMYGETGVGTPVGSIAMPFPLD